MKKGRNEERDDWVILSDDDPKIELFDRVVPIWCEVSHDWLEERAAQGYGLGFAGGFMAGVLMAALRPQWAAAYHTLVRRYYLTSGLTPEELQAWERHADATALALPVEIEGNQVMSTLPDSPSWADQYPEFAAKVKRAFERKEPETI